MPPPPNSAGGCSLSYRSPSNISRVLPFQVLLPSEAVGLRVDSKAQAEVVRSVAVERLGHAIGRLPAPVMALLEAALRLHLQL